MTQCILSFGEFVMPLATKLGCLWPIVVSFGLIEIIGEFYLVYQFNRESLVGGAVVMES